MFNPEIGKSINQVRRRRGVLPQLIADVFVDSGLIPRNHPSVQPEAVGYKHVWDMIIVAYAKVRSGEATPQGFTMFLAVAGGFGVTVLAIIFGLLAGFVKKAHAQTSIFIPQDTSQTGDLGWHFIDMLFGVQNGAGPVQKAMNTMLGYYSAGILVLAGILLLYHLLSMVAETAHSGVVMGKRANQVWAPIRLCFAMGLLVPVSGGPECGPDVGA